MGTRFSSVVAMGLLLGMALLAFPTAVSAQKLSPELEALEREAVQLIVHKNQPGAGIAAMEAMLHRAEETHGPESLEVAYILARLGDYTWNWLVDPDRAEPLFARSLAIYDKQSVGRKFGGWMQMCAAMEGVGRLTFQRGEYEAAVPLLERALTCMEVTQGTGWRATVTMDYLGDAYRALPKRPDMVAKADRLFERWLPILEDASNGPNDIRMAMLLAKQAKTYIPRQEWLLAAEMRSAAMELVEARAGATGYYSDKEWLKLEQMLLQDQRFAHLEANGEAGMEVLAYQTRLVAVDEKLYGPEHSRTVHDREWLEKWRYALLYEPPMKDGGSPWEYDDVDHGECVEVEGVAPTGASEMAYGRYKLVNNCDYPITVSACISTDRADGKPSPDFDKHQDGAPCPGFGWGSTALRENQTKTERTWYEYRNIKSKLRVCRKDWSFVGEDGELLPYITPIDAKYGCRKLRSEEDMGTPPSERREVPVQSEDDEVTPLCKSQYEC